MSPATEQHTPEPPRAGSLRRHLGLADVTAVHVGNILGSGIFVAPAAVALTFTGASGVLPWLVGGLIATCGALVYAEAGVRLPEAGGFYVIYRRVFGEPVAFVGGWAALLVTYPASIAAIAIIFSSYLGEVVPSLAGVPWLTAGGALVLVAASNIYGLRFAARAQRLLTGSKVLALAIVCVAAIAAGLSGAGGAHAAPAGTPPPGAGSPVSSLSAILGVLVVVLWTYDGWSDINMIAGEVRRPGRVLVPAVILGSGVLFVVYLTVQAAVGLLLSPARAGASDRVLAEAVEAGLGAGSGRMVAALVVLATFGSVHGIILAASRLGYAMARDRVFFAWFGQVHPSFGTPARAIGILSAASLFYVFASGFRDLLAFFSFTVWLFYGLTASGLILLRRRGIGDAGAWRVPGASVAPYVLILVGLAMSGSLLVENPRRSLTGLALLLVAFPIHALWRRLFPPDGAEGVIETDAAGR